MKTLYDYLWHGIRDFNHFPKKWKHIETGAIFEICDFKKRYLEDNFPIRMKMIENYRSESNFYDYYRNCVFKLNEVHDIRSAHHDNARDSWPSFVSANKLVPVI